MATQKKKSSGPAERLTPRDSVEPSDLEIIHMDVPCGWCMTAQCNGCKAEVYWEKKLYMCGCKKCCNGHKPSIES